MAISAFQPGCPCCDGPCCPGSLQELYLTTPLHTVTLRRTQGGLHAFYGEATWVVQGHTMAFERTLPPLYPPGVYQCGDPDDFFPGLIRVPVAGLIKYWFDCATVYVYGVACAAGSGTAGAVWQWLDVSQRALGYDVNTGNAAGSFNCSTLSGQYSYAYSNRRTPPTGINVDGDLIVPYFGATFTVSA